MWETAPLDFFICIWLCLNEHGCSMWKISSVWSTIKRRKKKAKEYFPRVNGLVRCNEAKPKGGIYAIRLLTKNVVRSFFLFFNYIDKYLIHLQYEFLDQTNNRQTFAIVSWRHANAFFRDIEPVIFIFRFMCVTQASIEDLLLRLLINVSVLFYLFFFFFFFFFSYYRLERRFQLNGRRSTSFRHCRSEGEWKRRRTIVQVERMSIREEYFNWFSSSNFAVLLSSSWLVCLKRKRKISSFSEINFLSFT